MSATTPHGEVAVAPEPVRHGVAERVMLAEIAGHLFGGGRDVAAKVGRFVLLEELGAGGMGRVFRAYDPELDRSLALKVMRRESGDAEAATRRLRAEALALAKLNHPNVVTIHEVQLAGDELVLAMELVEGRDLGEWARRNPPSRSFVEDDRFRTAIGYLRQAAAGLAAAHAAELVHRDFKPSNVLVGDDGRVRVADFGLARAAAEATPDPLREGSTLATRLASTARLSGTPRYMAPEQHAGRLVDARADQFAFCVAAWEVLFGDHPWEGGIPNGTLPDPPAGAAPSLARALLQGLAEDPSQRHASMDALLATLPAERPRRSSARGAAFAAGSAAVIAAVAVALAGESDPCPGARDRLRNIWDDDARTRLQAAFADVDRPYAQTAHDRVRERLDDYADRWVKMSIDNCEATFSRGAQSPTLMDRRSLCLERRLQALRSTVAVFIDADATVVRDALQVAEGLPELESCADVEHLLATPRPSAKAIAASRIVDAARAAWLAGRFDDAERTLAPIRDGTADLPEVQAAVSLLGSRLHFNAGRSDAARAELETALAAAAQAGDDALLAEIQIAFLFQTGKRTQHGELIDALARNARASVLRAGSPPLLSVFLEGSYAIARMRQGKLEDAVEADLTALRVIEAHDLGPRHEGVRRLNLAQTYVMMGAFEEARTSLDRARTLLTPTLGPGHPTMLALDNTEGGIAYEEGNYAAAREAFARAAAGLEVELGREHPRTVETWARLALALEGLERFDEALELQRKVVEYQRRTRGEDDPAHAEALSTLALILHSSGRPAQALEVHRRVVAIRTSTAGADHLEVALARLAQASALIDVDEPAAAREQIGRVLPRLLEILGPDDAHVALAYDELARSWLAEGRLDEASRELEHAQRIFAEHPDRRSIMVIDHRLLTGDLALARGESAAALQAYAAARELATEGIGPASTRVVRALAGEERARASAQSP